jgi:hypothetical protein
LPWFVERSERFIQKKKLSRGGLTQGQPQILHSTFRMTIPSFMRVARVGNPYTTGAGMYLLATVKTASTARMIPSDTTTGTSIQCVASILKATKMRMTASP